MRPGARRPGAGRGCARPPAARARARAPRGRAGRWWSRRLSSIWSPTRITGLSEYFGSCRTMPIRPPRSSRHCARLARSRSTPSNSSRSAVTTRRRRQQAHDGAADGRLARAALADDAQLLAPDRERHAAHGVDQPGPGGEGDAQVLDGQHGHGLGSGRGSLASSRACQTPPQAQIAGRTPPRPGRGEAGEAGTMTEAALAYWATGPAEGELRPARLRPPGPGEVLVRTLFSGVSRGTEALVALGPGAARASTRRCGPRSRRASSRSRSSTATPASAWSRPARPTCSAARCSASTRTRPPTSCRRAAVTPLPPGLPAGAGGARGQHGDRAQRASGTRRRAPGERIHVDRRRRGRLPRRLPVRPPPRGRGHAGRHPARSGRRSPRRSASAFATPDALAGRRRPRLPRQRPPRRPADRVGRSPGSRRGSSS